ncbi:hypothetical protein [Aquirufa regiilacus]|uniref:Fibronectin type-III domain-containing protein n=1 Tax=Aquirufa regiilacus TaxID=3024868 RepID=A0ABU3TTJ8_9BACT|nr:hypothetical protein [Aquirufa sp. LEOWEIH-7C]MDU0809194.1 hypothetical protein [Aquirufa sp. LEOWEIH-7C]
MKKILLFTFIVLQAYSGLCQLSDLHYLPPLKQESSPNYAIFDHKLYLTTPSVTSFVVDVYRGTSTSLYTSVTISKSSAGTFTLPATTTSVENNISMMDNANTGIVQSIGGLIFKSRNGEKFYVNYRGKSGSQATSITSKGRAALGTAFKWGGMPNRGGSYTLLSNSMGIMATEDNTTVNIFGYKSTCTFRLGNDPAGITSDAISITLNKGQSYVLEAPVTATLSPNIDGWLGASVTSDKPIAMSVGQLHVQPVLNVTNQDCGADQIIPENTLGRDYVFVRGNGADQSEFAIIVATQNGTKIFVNGSTTEIATINNGEYYIVPGSYYSTSSTTTSVPGGNMYVQTSKEAYAFQCLAGSTLTQTVDLNFIAPVNCLLSNKVDNISNITDIAGLTMTGGITLIASTAIADADIVVNYGANTVSLATLQAAKKSVAGTSDWKTFYLNALSGDVSVSAPGPIAVGFILVNSNAGASGYFSGFETLPTINVNVSGDGCLPGSTLVATAGFPSYAWYRNGVVIPGQTNNTYTPSIAGDYYVIVSTGSCDYQSASQSLYDCNPEVVTSVVADKNSVNSGQTITFSIKAAYLGYGNLSNLVIRNQIPSNLNVVSATPSYGTWTASGSDFNWNIGTMYPSEEHRLTVVTTVKTLSTNETQSYVLTNTQTQVDANKVVDDPSESILFLARVIPSQSNFNPHSKQVGQANFNLTPPNSNSTGAFTYVSSDTSVVKIIGDQVIIVGQGNANITATQAETATYAEKSIQTSISVLPKNGLIKTGKLSTTSAQVVNKNGARGFGAGHNQYGAPIVSLNTPTVYTKTISNITSTSASAGGIVISHGGKDVTARGVCWRRLPGATIEHNFTNDAGTIGAFNSSMTGLSPNTLYYVRAYATNKQGTSYGEEISFTTSN